MVKYRFSVALLLVVAGLVSWTAYGSGGTQARMSSEFAGVSKVKRGLRLAFFSVAGNNTYVVAGKQGATAAAKKYRENLKVFDAQFDGALQLNQVMGAIAQGGYDGFVIEPTNGQQLCAAVKAALKAKITVAVSNVPACSAGYSAPYPGTAGFVGGQSAAIFRSVFSLGFKSDPAGGEFAVLVGPAVHGNTERQRQVLNKLEAKYAKWKEVGFEATDYQASVGLTKTQNILVAHPNLKVIFSASSTITPGIIAALKGAGKLKSVRIYELTGGDKNSFRWLAERKIRSTYVILPYEEQYRAVQAVIAELSGLKTLDGVVVGAFHDLSRDARLKGLPGIITDPSLLPKYRALGLPEY